MGVKGLWTILEPLGEPQPLSELAGRSVAVDLSGWVVEAETAQSLAQAVSKPYLRNLVYRTSALLLQHTLPVFVLDGAAPQLKLQELARRQGRATASGGRQQLRGRLQRCARLLDALGVPHLTSDGEAEALCARLDADGHVDGVVSDDGDAALYGARTLYRNLSAGSTGGQVTRYCLRRVRDELGLDAVRLRELALLVGCDFLPAGLPGLGPQLAQQLVCRLNGRPLLPQLGRWLREPPLSEMRAVGELGRAPSHCVHCCHPGTETRHRRGGCPLCGGGDGCIAAPADAGLAVCPCEWHRQRRNAEEHTAELKARDCARRAPEFEARAAAAEAELARTPPLPKCEFSWSRPDLDQFVALAREELGWAPHQSWKVAAPLLARWQLRHGGAGAVEPLRLVEVMRTSRHHHIDCYLVRWKLNGGVEGQEVVTNEPRPLVEDAHRQIVDAFLDSKKKPKKAPARQPRKAKAASDAGPQAKIGVGSPSRLITDFFPTRKKKDQQTAAAAAVAGLAKSGPSPVAAPAGSGPASDQKQNPDPFVSSGVRVSGTARGARASGARAPSAAEPAVSPTDSPTDSLCLPAADSTGETDASDASDASDSYEELDSDGSVADLSAIIDAITRTHIADDAVIVISDDDDDVLEVSEGEQSGRHRAPHTAASRPGGSSVPGGQVAPSLSGARGTRTKCEAGGETRAPVSVPAAVGFDDRVVSLGCDRDAPRCDEDSGNAVGAGAASDLDSDDEYVPLCRRIALRP